MKRSHKLRSIRDAAGVVAAAGSMAEAAHALGVNRSTLHRWIKAGKVPAPAGVRQAPRGVMPPTDGKTASEWAAAVRAEFRDLTVTELQLVELAAGALAMTADGVPPSIRLQAMGRFQALVKQLRLGDDLPTEKPGKPAREIVRRVSAADPRKLLMVVN